MSKHQLTLTIPTLEEGSKAPTPLTPSPQPPSPSTSTPIQPVTFDEHLNTSVDLSDLNNDTVSVASVENTNTSESIHISEDMLKLEGKGLVGKLEKLPLAIKIIMATLLSVIGLFVMGAILIGFEASVLSSAEKAKSFVTISLQLNDIVMKAQRERGRGSLAITIADSVTYQEQYLAATKQTDDALKNLDNIEKVALASGYALGVYFSNFRAFLPKLQETRAKVVARQIYGPDSHWFYTSMITALTTIEHAMTGSFGENAQMVSNNLFIEVLEQYGQTRSYGGLVIGSNGSNPDFVSGLQMIISRRKYIEDLFLKGVVNSTGMEYKKQLAVPEASVMAWMESKLTSGVGGFSFTGDNWFANVTVVMNSILATERSIETGLTTNADSSLQLYTAMIIVVLILFVMFVLSSCTCTLLFSKTISGPWKRLNYLQELTISRFVPKGFLILMGWKRISDACLNTSIEVDVTKVIVSMENFAAVTEGMKREELFRYANDFLCFMGPYVRSNRGYIDKYLGTSFVAIFQKEGRAMKSALEMQDGLQNFNKINPAYKPLFLSIAVVSGKHMIGTIGENERMESASLGKLSLVANELPRIAGKIGVSIITLADTIEKVPKIKQLCRNLGVINVPKHGATNLYEIILPSEAQKLRSRDYFNRAVENLQNGKFSEATQILESVAQYNKNDYLVNLYYEMAKKAHHDNKKIMMDLTVSEVLQDNAALKPAFEEFCKTEHSLENINLWNEIKHYKSLESQEDRRKRAQMIVEEFLDLRGSQSANISEKVVNQVKEILEQHGHLHHNLFDHVRSYVELTMNDPLKRFKMGHGCREAFCKSPLRLKMDVLTL